MKLRDYMKESKMGKFPEKIARFAFMKLSPAKLVWKLESPATDDKKRNFKLIEKTAYKELTDMKKKGILDFYDDKFDVWKIGEEYEANVSLLNYDEKKLRNELKKLKFKI